MIALFVEVRNKRLAVIANALDAAVDGGLLRIYSAPRPAIDEALVDQDLLVEIRLPKPCTASVDNGTLIFAPIGAALCRRSGDAVWARLLDGDEHPVADMDVGLVGSNAEIALSKTALLAGGAVNVSIAEIID